MKTFLCVALSIVLLVASHQNADAQTGTRMIQIFTEGWMFHLGDTAGASTVAYDDRAWRRLNLPHDWSIELPFDKNSPAGTGGGALTGGTGWYRKTFVLPAGDAGKQVYIDFDGVYRNSEVWINGHYLGKRPNGYISFRYELSLYLNFGTKKNVLAVRVDNSKQPNSRWYSGSGIYRNVWLVTMNRLHVAYNGTCITTTDISAASARVHITTTLEAMAKINGPVVLHTVLYDRMHKVVGEASTEVTNMAKGQVQDITVTNPVLWSTDKPYIYNALTTVLAGGKVFDNYISSFGIRYFAFDADKGFLLNGKHLKINGVCDHHDLGCLGTAINTRALQRQLEILKAMGCNGIRTSHNPPAPELLELCDIMGFIVVDEAFDMWKKEKNPFDYHLDWDEWHEKDLRDQVIRDRNHPCVFVWSIGNEVNEQWDKTDTISGMLIARELVSIVKSLDTTRPTVSALSNPYPVNPLVKADALDLIGYNYDNKDLPDFHKRFPGRKFLGTETVSALETRGFYDFSVPTDSIRRWPERWDKPFTGGFADHSVSAYDNVSAPWGGTHEETWKMFKKYDFLSGQYIWTGFDYIGEPTPYEWPSHSSYFGIIDLAGFPKDVYYMYQSEWTNKPVLHLLPDSWNWKNGDVIDIWAYYNNADEVELYLNDKSLGVRKKQNDDLHVAWKGVKFDKGVIKAVSRKDGKTVLTEEIRTPVSQPVLSLKADRDHIRADTRDLSFITVKSTDKDGNFYPVTGDTVVFTITGPGFIAGVDNGSQTSLEPFKADRRTLFNGKCLVVIQSTGAKGTIHIKATAKGVHGPLFKIEGGETDVVAE